MQEITLKKEKISSLVKEELNTLRTNVEFSGEDIKTIAITSCLENEGKSTISHQLAISFAEEGKKTLLIDADLRKSVLKGKIAEGTVKLGLADYLVGRSKLMDVLTTTDNPNLFIIFAGYVPPNPSELLNNKYFENLLVAAKETFEVIIVDTPPIGEVIDAAIVASKTDGTVVVMKQAGISYQLARNIKEQLDVAGARILGCVLNKVGSKGSFYGKYYGKYYNRYGKSYYKKYYRRSYGNGYGYGYGYGTYGKPVYGQRPTSVNPEFQPNQKLDIPNNEEK